MDLTGVVAKIVMAWWDKEFLRRLETNNVRVNLYKRYVDDINISVEMMDPGKRFVNGRLQVVHEYVQEDVNAYCLKIYKFLLALT